MTPDAVTARIHEILRARSRHIELQAEVPLGADGLGLDSIALVEVLLECEDAFGVGIASEMLSASPLTVGLLVERIQALVQP